MWLMERLSLRTRRQALLEDAHGRILEIGAGTGANLPLYPADAQVTAVDVACRRLAGAVDKAGQNGLHGRVIISCASAHDLPFPDDFYDTVVSTLVFCSVPDVPRGMAEIRRVLRPGGRLLMMEHVRGTTAVTRRLTDWLHPPWFAMQGECHLNRETAVAVAEAGFQIDALTESIGGVLQTIHAHLPKAGTQS